MEFNEIDNYGHVFRSNNAIIMKFYFDPVFARVTDDLRWGVEPHRLAVEKCRRENRRISALQPGGYVDQ